VGDRQAATSVAKRWYDPEKPRRRSQNSTRRTALDPHNAEALYSRGLLYQARSNINLRRRFHGGEWPDRSEPSAAGSRVSYLALDKINRPLPIYDEAVQAVHRRQILDYPGLAYERLGDKTKAAGYRAAPSPRPRMKPRRTGFARVGARPDSAYSRK